MFLILKIHDFFFFLFSKQVLENKKQKLLLNITLVFYKNDRVLTSLLNHFRTD